MIIWYLVIVLKQSDPKFTDSVGFYYSLWILVYLPIAILGTVTTAKSVATIVEQGILGLVSLSALLIVLGVSFHLDIHWRLFLSESC